MTALDGTLIPSVALQRRGAFALPGLGMILGAGALLQGAFYPSQLTVICIAAVLVAASSARIVEKRAAWIGFGALALGLLFSAAATSWPDDAWKPAATLVLAGAVYSIADRARATDGARAVLEALVGVAALVAVLGIAGVVMHIEPLGTHADTWRLASTLTYFNAAAGVFAIALGPAAMLAARGTGLHRTFLVAIGIGLVATQSRGGLLAGLVACAVLVRLRGVSVRALFGPALGVAVGAGSMVPVIIDASFGAPLAIAGIGSAALLAVSDSRALRALAALAVIGALLALPFTPIRDRLKLTTTDRSRVWSATIDQARAHALFGTGPGTYSLTAEKDGFLVRTEFAHNEYLQSFSETGIVGLASVLVAVGAFASTIWRRRHAVWAPAAAAAGSAFLVHSAFDFVWRVPVLVAMVFTVLAAGSGSQEESWKTPM